MEFKYLKIFILVLILSLFFTLVQADWTAYDELENLVSNYVNSLYADEAGNIWFGSGGAGVQKFDGIDWPVYNHFNGLINDAINDITSDPAGNLWFATTFGVGSFDGVSEWDQFNQEDHLDYVDIKTMVVDDSGFLWLGTFGAGVVKHDADTTTVAHYTIDSGLAGNNILASLIDSDGNKWFGTRNGVSKLDLDGNWTTYEESNSGLLDDTVNVIMQDPSGYIWFGTNTGLNRFDRGSEWVDYTEAGDGLAPGAVTAVAMDSLGYIWVGHSWTNPNQVWISQFDGAVWTTFNRFTGIGSNASVTDIAVTVSGVVWFATLGDGVYSYEHEPSDTPDDNRPTLPGKFILSQNYPNPFNASTSIKYSLMSKTDVEISIYNTLGRKVKRLVNTRQEAGQYTIKGGGIDGDGYTVRSGIYFYEIKTGDFKEAKKMLLMK